MHDEVVQRRLFRFCFSLGAAVLINGCNDGDSRGDDGDDAAPSTYILASGYGNSYRILNGDTFEEYEPVVPDYADGFQSGPSNAILVPGLLPGDGMVAIFTALPQSGTDNAQIFSADAFTGKNVTKMTDYERPGTGGMVPAGLMGFLLTAADEVHGISGLMKMNVGDTKFEPVKGIFFEKNIEGQLCKSWGGFQSPAYSPGGVGYAAGWSCKHMEEDDSDLKEYLTVLAFDAQSGDCGDPVWTKEMSLPSIQDLCYTPESDFVIFSVGMEDEAKQVYVGPPDGSSEAKEITASFMNGEFQHFSCDPYTERVVFNNIAVNPDLFVLGYSVSGDSVSFESEPKQITTLHEYRRPRWVKAK